nr:NUDIX domain-containing protein [Microbacterium sp. CPCC 204701]
MRASAAVVVDRFRRALVVRKHDADVFQQPGGKPDHGETPLDAVVREVAEETGILADPADFEPLGRFTDAAANEPGHTVVADAYLLRAVLDAASVVAAAEIAKFRWIAQTDVAATPLAPLSRNHLIRFAWR